MNLNAARALQANRMTLAAASGWAAAMSLLLFPAAGEMHH
jgi:hypothetical protein